MKEFSDKMKCEQHYFETYDRAAESVMFCPYRISPLGAHMDHQYGKINGLAIDKGIHIAYSRKENGVVELQSLNFPKRAQFHVASIPEEKVGDWADHCRGAAKMLSEKYPLHYGISGVIEGITADWRPEQQRRCDHCVSVCTGIGEQNQAGAVGDHHDGKSCEE